MTEDVRSQVDALALEVRQRAGEADVRLALGVEKLEADLARQARQAAETLEQLGYCRDGLAALDHRGDELLARVLSEGERLLAELARGDEAILEELREKITRLGADLVRRSELASGEIQQRAGKLEAELERRDADLIARISAGNASLIGDVARREEKVATELRTWLASLATDIAASADAATQSVRQQVAGLSEEILQRVETTREALQGSVERQAADLVRRNDLATKATQQRIAKLEGELERLRGRLLEEQSRRGEKLLEEVARLAATTTETLRERTEGLAESVAQRGELAVKEIRKRTAELEAGLGRRSEQLQQAMTQKYAELAAEIARREDAIAEGARESIDRVGSDLIRRSELATRGIQQRVARLEEKTDQVAAQLSDAIVGEVAGLRAALTAARDAQEKLEGEIRGRIEALSAELDRSCQEILKASRKMRSSGGPAARSLDLGDLTRACMSHLVPASCPLVLISQVQRSGGTLLSQLFDGHRECHAHPHELYIGRPDKTTWPTLDLAESPERWFETLFERPSVELAMEGYEKYGAGRGEDAETFAFLFLPQLQRELFLAILSGTHVTSPRQVLDAYMTSYFNAWLNNRNLRGPKKLVTAFTPSLATWAENVERFFADYPDGWLVSILRDPHGWYSSARLHKAGTYGDLEAAIGLWKESTEAAARNRERFGARVVIVRFEDLVQRTEGVMRRLSAMLGIEYADVLLTPTFNGQPIKANSSFGVARHGVLVEPIDPHARRLKKAERAAIDALAGDLYGRVGSVALTSD